MDNFDDIRPYYDSEIPDAVKRIAQWSQFAQLARSIYPDLPTEKIIEQLCNVSSIHELQTSFMNPAIKCIIKNTSTGFSFSGIDYIKRNHAYMYIANHRDIALDAFLLQHVLLERKGDTSYVVFGNNLIASPIIGDIFRSNKLIQMSRGGSPREFYRSLQHLSLYINQLVVKQKQSVWIAQKNGRSKDGIDTTAPALIKMLTLGGEGDPKSNLNHLHIVPISISYEWDPCDVMKVNEIYQSRRGTYVKAEGEDLNSVATGIIGNKGRIHLSIARPIATSELTPPEGVDIADHVANVLDRRIQSAYRLMPTNYLAYDLLTGKRQYRSHYTSIVKHTFLDRMNQLPTEEHRRIFLEMYANPTISSLKY